MGSFVTPGGRGGGIRALSIEGAAAPTPDRNRPGTIDRPDLGIDHRATLVI